MKISLIILSLVIGGNIFSQDSTDLLTKDSFNLANTNHYFKVNNIPLNNLIPPKGYQVLYNCDSMLFMRGNFSDTIKIWTPGMEWAYTLQQFKKVTIQPQYGKTVFAKSISSDGRILVDYYMETIFIHRNDSLFQVLDTVTRPPEYFSMMVDRMLGKIDDASFKPKKDSFDLIYNGKHSYVQKLIFAKSMFQNGKKKIKLSRNINFEQDEIELEREWEEEQKKCYLIRIHNRSGKEKTSYAYAINEDIKFIWWEGCRNMNRY